MKYGGTWMAARRPFALDIMGHVAGVSVAETPAATPFAYPLLPSVGVWAEQREGQSVREYAQTSSRSRVAWIGRDPAVAERHLSLRPALTPRQFRF
jgi:hypothetical protein